jgi:GNAT superfamily N-acetyltransferase
VRRFLYRLGAAALYYGGVERLYRFLRRRRLRVLVLDVATRTEPAFVERLLRHLKCGYRVLPLEQALEGLWGGGSPLGVVALTCNTGLADFRANVYPLLHSHGVPATLSLDPAQANWEECQEMLAGGLVSFAARTGSSLSSCAAGQETEAVRGLRQAFAGGLATAPVVLSYYLPGAARADPWSAWEAGFRAAVSKEPGLASCFNSPYHVPSVALRDGTTAEIALQVSGLGLALRNFSARPWSALGNLRRRLAGIDRYFIYRCALNTPLEEVPTGVPAEFRFGGPENWDEYGVLCAWDRVDAQRRSAEGDLCLFGRVSGRLACFCWLRFDRVDLVGEGRPVIVPAPQAIHLYHCETALEYRGKRLYPAALQFACRWARERGYRMAYIHVDEENLPSIRGIERAGFRRCGQLTVLHLGKLRTARLAWDQEAPDGEAKSPPSMLPTSQRAAVRSRP